MRRLCTTATTATTVFLMLLLTGSFAHAQNAAFQSSTQKYRERNPAGGKGRSGGATMAARMLYAKNGTTLLEATTGEFDSSAPATGEFMRVKLTAYDGNGLEMFAYQYQPAGGSYFQQTYNGFSPGQPFTVQGHIRSDARRNTPVTVTTTVQKRPDLFAERIVTSSRVPVGIPVQILGIVSELNGHLGARTECVLYANDVEVDRSSAIWVDSGDTVSCAFSPTFATIGAVDLKLKAESVAPGDWDLVNNVVERRIEVSDLTPEYDGAAAEALAVDTDFTASRQYGRYVNSTVTAGYDWFYEDTANRSSDVFVYAGVAMGITMTPSALHATASDGETSWELQRSVPGCFDFAVGRVNGRSFYTYVTGCGDLYVQVGSYAGTVTYASRALARTFHVASGAVVFDGPAQYIYNNVTTEVVDGERLLHGSVWTIDVAVAAGPFVFSAPVAVTLGTAFDDGAATPYVCGTVGVSTGAAVACNSTEWRVAGRYGEASYLRTIP